MSKNEYIRPNYLELLERLQESRRFLQVLMGARQVGKSTLAQQVAEISKLPIHFVSADGPTLRGAEWIEGQWEIARSLNGQKEALLILDEVQKIPHWDEVVKSLWDEDTRQGRKLKVVLLGSVPLLIGRGLTESLAGRFETLYLPHWSFSEMRDAFGFTLDEYLFYGGYPGAAPLIGQPQRWSNYILNSLIETTLSRDILLLSRVDKPALLRQLFDLGCRYSGQILSYNKMLGQLQGAGNTTTLAHYLELLASAGMLIGLKKYSRAGIRMRRSSPKLQVLNTALMSALSGKTLSQARGDKTFWGRLVESAVGVHLVSASVRGLCQVFYWQENNREVDFVLESAGKLLAIEVKSGQGGNLSGMTAFARVYRPERKLIVGGDGIKLEEFLSRPVEHWI